MKKVLVLDGGGAKGLLQNAVIKELEKTVGKKVCDIFDLIVGTSVGAINGAMYATGKFISHDDNDVFDTFIETVFSEKHNIPPIYKAYPIKVGFEKYLGSSFTMGQCKTKFMCTAVSAVDKMTHYFKSWEPKDGAEPLYDVVRRSFAAPVYFGQVIDEYNRQVWLDGGTGIANSPLIPALEEIDRLGWKDGGKSVLLINIGTGYSMEPTPFDEAKKFKFTRETAQFMDPLQSGLARYQSINYQRLILEQAKEIMSVVVDCKISESLDSVDELAERESYERLGRDLFKFKLEFNNEVMKVLKS